ncbi:aminotransferase [Pleurocapsa sp. CCALA 161]|uniref:phytanoyl-CoA dioxygenase family protein n=1 Tax=Pleurocapsa sp. CCALA 161 TaxID=2107688 RepID=UPI000D052E25|nr:phytanoyl-CoA dioxygenase family protein [Pleurocapsa sp. CCALA 161]PSB08088.1 aminotransferase [Pleurocapsa sp. CCALA 161]
MNASISKFTIDDVTEIKKHYESHGYVVVRKLLADSKIDCLIEQYEKIKLSKFFVYYSQSLHQPLRPKITPEGFIEQSIERPSHLKFFPGFSQAVLNCLIDREISDVLSILSGSPSHSLWLNMFFDKSPGTVEHQDHYYLDTNPPGNLIGVWYALENIHPDSGCFFVLPGSHKGEVISRRNFSSQKKGIAALVDDHERMRKKIITLIREKNYEYLALPLSKGDVLFWHPYTIHGAYNNNNPQYSRKSLTGHFYPSNLKKLYTKTPLLKRSPNPNILVRANDLRIYAWNIKQYAVYFLNQFRGQKPLVDMRRESYKNNSDD